MYQYIYVVGEEDLQPLYRHVNHARALSYLEWARTEFLKDINCPQEKLIAKGIFSVVVSVNIRYKRELFAGEIKVSCEDMEIRGKSLFVRQKIYNSKGKEAVSALVELMFLMSHNKRAGQVPAEISKAVQGIAYVEKAD